MQKIEMITEIFRRMTIFQARVSLGFTTSFLQERRCILLLKNTITAEHVPGVQRVTRMDVFTS